MNKTQLLPACINKGWTRIHAKKEIRTVAGGVYFNEKLCGAVLGHYVALGAWIFYFFKLGKAVFYTNL